MLASVMFGMYPYILVPTTDSAFSLPVFNASTDSYGLTIGIGWFGVGFLLILAYQIYLHSPYLNSITHSVTQCPLGTISVSG